MSEFIEQPKKEPKLIKLFKSLREKLVGGSGEEWDLDRKRITYLDLRPELFKGVSREEFEELLFKSGVYRFNFGKDSQDLTRDLVKAKDWYVQNPGWDEDLTTYSMGHNLLDAQHEFQWRVAFDGKVPENWKPRYVFILAGILGFQLSENLVNAGVSDISTWVVAEVGKSQRLNENQLELILARSNLNESTPREVIDAQRAMGMEENTIESARRRAEVLKKKMENKKLNELGEFWSLVGGNEKDINELSGAFMRLINEFQES